MATNTCEKPGSSPFDASGDGDPAIDAATCYGTFAPICPVAPITMPLSITSSTTIDTDTSPMCIEHAAANELCVIAGTAVSISRPLRGIGSRPLVVLATDTLTVMGPSSQIDVASHATETGAGANPAGCVAGGAATGQQGAGGGSFGGTGGRGADLENVNGPLASAPAVMPVATLRGGCRDGSGAGAQVSTGGAGGGAVMLIAKTSITINTMVNASGAGGAGGEARSGGAGGGSGGMIVLDAPEVTVALAARVAANGGGGGEGGTRNHGGDRGGDGATGILGAGGGAGGSNHGGNGGAGAAGMNRDGISGAIGEQCNGAGGENGRGGGGGGGGGSAGVIRIFTTTPSLLGQVSPPAT